MSSSKISGRPRVLGVAGHALWVLAAFSVWFAIFFSPVLFEGRLFPSDGMLATFQSPKGLWNPLPFAGVPALGDPQLAQLYPLRWVFAALPGEIAFNYYIAFAYVLASSLTYGYVLRITQSRVAAVIGGLVFGTSGYMRKITKGSTRAPRNGRFGDVKAEASVWARIPNLHRDSKRWIKSRPRLLTETDCD